MMDGDSRKDYLHTLERKLTSLRKRMPVYCHCMVLFDEDTVCVTLPGVLDGTIRIPVDYDLPMNLSVKKVHDTLLPYFPVIRYLGKEYFIDKVDFRTNTFVVKATWKDEEWASFYRMRQPITILLKDLQSTELTPDEKAVLFCRSIRNNTSREDFRVL